MAEIRCPLLESAQISKHEPSVIYGDRTLLYFEYDELAICAAAHLREAGVGEGTRVALLLSPDWKYLVLIMGLLRIRAVVCPLNTRMPASVLKQQLNEIDCKLVIARPTEAALLGGNGLTVLDPDAMARHSQAYMDLKWSEHYEVDQPASILFTSGSMGVPRLSSTPSAITTTARGVRTWNIRVDVRATDGCSACRCTMWADNWELFSAASWAVPPSPFRAMMKASKTRRKSTASRTYPS